MQVSWIDPEEIARLASELNGPLPPPETISPWELSTLPDVTADALLPQVNVGVPVQGTSAPGAPAAQPAAPVHAPQLDHIREKLRAIRSRAQDAGLLPPKKEEVPASSAPWSRLCPRRTLSPHWRPWKRLRLWNLPPQRQNLSRPASHRRLLPLLQPRPRLLRHRRQKAPRLRPNSCPPRRSRPRLPLTRPLRRARS